MLSRSGRNRRSLGFTLIELLVVISIISLLIAILLPALSSARNAARGVLCLSNQRQVGSLTYLYANDFREYMPFAYSFPPNVAATTFWYDLLATYNDDFKVKNKKSLYACASIEERWGSNFNGSYGMNELLTFNTTNAPMYRLSSVLQPTNTFLIGDSFQRSATNKTIWSYYGLQRFPNSFFPNVPPPYYHSGGVAALMMGGNAAIYSVEAAAKNTSGDKPWIFDPQ